MGRSVIRNLLVATALLAGTPAQAAIYCAQNSAELAGALQTASGNGVSDTIRITAGTYTAGAAGFYGYVQAGESLTIEGGWSSVFGNCNINTFDPTITVLDGENQRQALRLAGLTGSGSITLRGVTLFRGRANGGAADRGGGLYQSAAGGWTGNVLVERNVFRQGFAQLFGGGAHVASDGGVVTVRNNLFFANTASEAGALYAFGGNATTYINNNTLAGNFGLLAGSAQATFTSGGSNDVLLSNNVFWNNLAPQQFDLTAGNRLLIANDIQQLSGTPQSPSAGNVSVDPRFVAGGNYRLREDSPLVDFGADPPIGGVPTLDLAGQPRNAGRLDLGAYELDRLLSTGFEN